MRFKVLPSAEGALRILRDVIVEWSSKNEWIAISREAAAVDERMGLTFGFGGSTEHYPVRVLESRPVIVDGSIRHRLRLRLDPFAAEEQ